MIVILILLVVFVSIPSEADIAYTSWAVSEWLVNYQAGFVRRGLIGEILWQFYHLYPYNVKILILFIDYFVFIAFAVIMYRICRDKRWSPLVILFPFACCMTSLTYYRRDFLMMCLCYVVFDYTLCFIKKNKLLDATIAVLLAIICILMYEPIFFIQIPILAWIVFLQGKGSRIKRLVRCSVLFSLPTICMVIVCLQKGNIYIGQAIWESWVPTFETYPEISGLPTLGAAVSFFGKTTTETMLFHLNYNFGIREPLTFTLLMQNVTLIFLFVAIYYLTTRILVVDISGKHLYTNNQGTELSQVLLLQMMAMIPMFTVLSCDYGRTLPYCIYTTLFLVYLLGKHHIQITCNHLSIRVQSFIDGKKQLCSPWTYLLLIWFTPICFYPSPLPSNCLLYNLFSILNSLSTQLISQIL